MPSYSFKSQFVPYVLDGTKTHTIRNRSKRNVKAGDMLYLFYALRTKYVKRLLEVPCNSVNTILIGNKAIYIFEGRLEDYQIENPLRSGEKFRKIQGHQLNEFAWKDGFRPEGSSLSNPMNAFTLMSQYFDLKNNEYQLGDIISWGENPYQINFLNNSLYGDNTYFII